MRPDRPAAKLVGNNDLLNFSRGSITKKKPFVSIIFFDIAFLMEAGGK
jgi:hypothetical protein